MPFYGEKLWCTNGTKAGVIVVMARTPPKISAGKPKDQITAFIVETDWPGVEVTHRCRFMGLKALYNGVMNFNDVRVRSEEHTSELQSQSNLVCRLLLEKKKKKTYTITNKKKKKKKIKKKK